MKLIITGATGFIGRHIADRLIEDGHEVIGIGRNPKIGSELEDKGVVFRTVDITSLEEMTNSISEADCMIHCAAKIGGWGKYGDFYNANVLGTSNVIHACRKYGINKIITVSSPSIYYTGKDRINVNENDPVPNKLANHYSTTKLMADRELLKFEREGFKTIILRPRAVHGPFDRTIIPHILSLSERKNMPLINGGNALSDVTYIDNLVDAVVLSMHANDKCWNEIYNISNGDPIKIKDWFAQVLKAFKRPYEPKVVPLFLANVMATLYAVRGSIPVFGKEPPMTHFSVGYLAHTLTMSIQKAKDALGYYPKVTNQQGFEMHASWYIDRQTLQ